MKSMKNGKSQNKREMTGQRVGAMLHLIISWLAVLLPLLWGIIATLRKALLLFQ